MDNQQATAFELGWLVGAIDGEGCIGITLRNRKGGNVNLKPHIQISNCDKEFMDRCEYILSKLEFPYHLSHYTGKGRRRDSWQINISGLRRVHKVLPLLAELFCDEKREKAKLVLEFCETRLKKGERKPGNRQSLSPRELEIYEIVAGLNKKGRKAQSLRDYTRNTRGRTSGEDIVQTTTE